MLPSASRPPGAVTTAWEVRLSRRLRSTTEDAEGLLSLNVTQRIARKLLQLMERYGVPGEDGVLIDLNLSQEAMATLVGTTRESANRALSALRDQERPPGEPHRFGLFRVQMVQVLGAPERRLFA